MKRNLSIKPLHRVFSVLLIMCICSSVQCSAQAVEQDKPNVGLIRFSIDVFDKQKGLVENERNRVENRLKTFLKGNFKFKKEFYFKTDQDVITYSDIEDPDVTIDPQFESRADKKLKELSKKHNLAAIVFGHFQEEDDLIVVFRYYDSKDQKIVSTQSASVKIDEKITGELQKQADRLAKELEDQLKARFVKTQPENKQDKVNKPDDQEKHPPVNPNETPKKNETGVQSTPPKTTTAIEETLTAHEVYQMISENGFYCEIVEGSEFHGEGLKGITLPEKNIFKDSRSITIFTEFGKNLIRTESQLKSGNGKKIVLGWPSAKEITLKRLSYKEAQSKIAVLNRSNKDTNRKWRVPTIMELFSIIRGDTKNHFPEIFYFPRKEKDIIFWTSTVVKKEGTNLDYDNKNKAYLVVRSLYSPKNDIYSVSFAPFNIEGKEPKQAYLLPVYPEDDYRYKPIIDQLEDSNILGFDDDQDSTGTSAGSTTNSKSSTPPQSIPPASTASKNQSTAAAKSSEDNKIPGFDDIPDIISDNKKIERSTRPGIQNHHSTNRSNKSIAITLIPYICKGNTTEVKEQELNDINDEIEKGLNLLKRELNFPLIIDKKKSFNPKHQTAITKVFNILNDGNIDNDMKFTRIYSDIMANEKIDIIITIKFSKYEGGIEESELFFINSFDKDIIKKKHILSDQHINLFESLMQSINKFIADIISRHYTIK